MKVTESYEGKRGDVHNDLWKSRPGAWRLCSIATLMHVACFL